LYPTLINAGLRIWIYSGDNDGAVPIVGTLNWIQQLKQQLQMTDVEFWRPWFTSGEYSSTGLPAPD
jgi:serine carboxypeptidase-like clade 2